jgi:hypothetical protein
MLDIHALLLVAGRTFSDPRWRTNSLSSAPNRGVEAYSGSELVGYPRLIWDPNGGREEA